MNHFRGLSAEPEGIWRDLGGAFEMLQTFPMSRSTGQFIALVTDWTDIPRSAWLAALFSASLSSALTFAIWASGGRFDGLLVVTLPALAAIQLWALYLGTTGILQLPVTIPGCLRFMAASLAALVPLIATASLIFWRPGIVAESFGIVLVAAGFGGVLVAALLSAWPVAQAISGHFVSPLRVIEATRGHRLALICTSFLISMIGKANLIPDMTQADVAGEALLIGCGEVLMSLLNFGLATGLIATAWKFAVENDPSLAQEAPEPA